MKNRIIFTRFLLVSALFLTSFISPKEIDDKGTGGRGKIITETDKGFDQLGPEEWVIGEIYLENLATKTFERGNKKFKIKKKEFPCWFKPGTGERDDWVMFIYLPEDTDDPDNNVEIVGYIKTEFNRRCK